MNYLRNKFSGLKFLLRGSKSTSYEFKLLVSNSWLVDLTGNPKSQIMFSHTYECKNKNTYYKNTDFTEHLRTTASVIPNNMVITQANDREMMIIFP